MFTNVLIVGAGPTGLMLANQLGRRGIATTIIDRHSGPAQQSRAMAVHARTLEIYAKLGIADRAVERGRPGNGGNIWSGGRHRARIPFTEMGKDLSAFPYVLMLGQDENERLMGDLLTHWGISVQWNTELIGLEQRPECVVATIKTAEGTVRTITAAYVAGCDGSRSAVRDMCGIGFPGAAYEHSFFVADTEATGPMIPDELNVFLWGSGFHLYFPMRGENCWRVIGILPRDLSARDHLTFEQLLPTLLHRGAPGLSFTACHWFSTYRIQHRCTERFRDRRCFLLGDAAHVHSPMGGQGMNTGLQDAYNLAWKLALVVNNQADDTLLDTYEAERRPFAQQLLATTDRAFQTVVSDNWLTGLLRTKVIPRVAAFAMRRAAVRRKAFLTLSQIGIRYRDSALSRTLDGMHEDGPRAGDRFPWMKLKFHPQDAREDLFRRMDDTRFNLLAIGQAAPDLPAAWADTLNVHRIPVDVNAHELAAASIASPSYYLLRPDGHIALAGRVFEKGALIQWFADASVRLAHVTDGGSKQAGRGTARDNQPAGQLVRH